MPGATVTRRDAKNSTIESFCGSLQAINGQGGSLTVRAETGRIVVLGLELETGDRLTTLPVHIIGQ